MPSFVRIDVTDKLACQGGVKLGTLYDHDLKDAKDIVAIDDQESLTFVTSRVDETNVTRAAVSQLLVRRVAAVIWDDGSFDEWRIAVVDDGQGIGGTVTVTCNPLILDLVEGADSSTGKGLVSTTALCLRVFSFGVQALTATQIWDTYVIPNAPTWVTRGTIDPTAMLPQLSWDRLTPHALALQVRDTLRKMNISCELRLRRNGTTDYKLDLVTQIGSGAAVPLFYPRTNLQTLKRRTDANQQATRVFVTGEADPSGTAGIPGRARWTVTNVNGGTLKLTLTDLNAGPGPIGMTDQWKNAYVARVLTGRTFQIQASDAAAQTVTLLDVSTIAAGEVIELRLTEPLTNTRGSGTRFAITNVAGNNLTFSGNPITANSEYLDWYVKVWTAASAGSVVGTPQRITASTAATDVVAVASTAGFNNTQFGEFIQLDGAGEIASYLDHATQVQAPPTGYGMKAGDLAVSTVLGVTNLAKNSWMRAWSNGANPPDGWSLATSGTPGPTSRNSNVLFTRYGGFSYQIDFFGNVLITPRLDAVLAAGNTRLSVRAFLYFTIYAPPAGQVINLQLSALNADGSIGSTLGTVNAAGALNAWLTMEIVGVDVALSQAQYGMVVTVQANPALSGNNQMVAYVDSVEVYGFATNPADVFEYGDATVLHQAANRQLLSNGTPPIAYEIAIHDLERQNPTDWAVNALTLGGNVRVVNPDVSVDTTVRLLRRERDLLRPKLSTVGLSNLPALLLRLVQTTG